MQGQHATSHVAQQDLMGGRVTLAAIFAGALSLVLHSLLSGTSWIPAILCSVTGIVATVGYLMAPRSSGSQAFLGIALAVTATAWLVQAGASATGIWVIALTTQVFARTTASALGFTIASTLLLPIVTFGIVGSTSPETVAPVGVVVMATLLTAGWLLTGWKIQQPSATEAITRDAYQQGQASERLKQQQNLQQQEAPQAATEQLQQELKHREAQQQNLQQAFDETKASLGDYSQRIEVNLGRIHQVIASFERINELVERSGKQAADANEAVHIIASSNREVVDVVSSVDEIAFQTNLLALNASVEAARAGTSGAGFAVVATEVRNLALRSAESAKQIRKMMDASTQQIHEGLERVRNSRKTANNIQEEAKVLHETLVDISKCMQNQGSVMAELQKPRSPVTGSENSFSSF